MAGSEALSGAMRVESELRRRLAADLHDEPLQAVAAVAMSLELLRMQRGEDYELRELEDAAREATHRLRRVLAAVTGPETGVPLADALKAHVVLLGERCAIRVEEEPPEDMLRIVGLLAAEAAAAGATGVRIGRREDHVVMSVEGAEGCDLELVSARTALAGGDCSQSGGLLEIVLPVG